VQLYSTGKHTESNRSTHTSHYRWCQLWSVFRRCTSLWPQRSKRRTQGNDHLEPRTRITGHACALASWRARSLAHRGGPSPGPRGPRAVPVRAEGLTLWPSSPPAFSGAGEVGRPRFPLALLGAGSHSCASVHTGRTSPGGRFFLDALGAWARTLLPLPASAPSFCL